MSRRISAFVVAALVAGCGAVPSPSPVPSSAGTPSPTPVATPAPASASPSGSGPGATPTPTLTTGGLVWVPGVANEAAAVNVPLDYAHPGAGVITLAVVRRPAPDPTKRIGTLFLNPGGPGASGVTMLANVGGLLPAAVLDRFDLVSWDPRGVGLSQGITCPDASTVLQVQALDPTPSTPAEIAAYRTAFDTVAAQCEAASGALLPYVSEANTARDMDAIRAAMGEATISYWGWSYGTYLGYLYATMFSTRLRAAVLDGPVNPTQDLAGRDDSQARGFEIAFDHELALCAASTACPFHGGANPAKAYATLMAKLERQPIEVPGMGKMGPGEAQAAVIAYLYSGDPLPLLQALADAEAGDGSALLGAAKAYYAQVDLGSYLATSCLDVEHGSTPEAIAAELAATRVAAPRFAGQVILADAYGCLEWPVHATPVPVGPAPSGLPPILVVSSRYDPATPPWDAQPLASALGTGVVLTRDGLGHTSGGSMRENPCLSAAGVAYMVGLQPPPSGTVCTDPPPIGL